jgi:hypothetical protein
MPTQNESNFNELLTYESNGASGTFAEGGPPIGVRLTEWKGLPLLDTASKCQD